MRIFKSYYRSIALFLFPGLILYLFFFAIPVFQTFFESFFYWKGLKIDARFHFVGLGNYLYLFKKDPYFWKAFYNTVFLMLGSVIFQTVAGFALAMLLDSGIRLKRFLNISFFMPVVLSSTSVSLMWRFIFHPQGLINHVLKLVGLGSKALPWLAVPTVNMGAILVVVVWQGTGIVMILFLAGLADISKEIYESCAIEGANRWQTVFHITIPMLRPVFITVITLILINAAKGFDVIWILTGGGPYRSSEVLTTLMYREGLILNEPAYGGTVASFILILLLFISFMVRFQKKENR